MNPSSWKFLRSILLALAALLAPLSAIALNSDGKPDLLWRKYGAAGGDNAGWLMNGTARLSSIALQYSGDPNWVMVGTGDFNNDNSYDILWRHATTGQNAVWFMNGANFLSSAMLTTVADLNWEIVGTGYFFSGVPANACIVWRNKLTGDNAIWRMNGTTQVATYSILTVSDLNWKIAAVGDFNNDGVSDLLWRNYATGDNAIWYMNGASQASVTVIQSEAVTNWQIVGAGHFNTDDKLDILWRHKTTGDNAYWYMNGATFLSAASIDPVSDLTWRIGGVADNKVDSDADGMPDLWERNNFGSLSQAATGDFDGDGISNLQEYLNSNSSQTAPPTVSTVFSADRRSATVTGTAPPGVNVRYTTNGQDPTLGSSATPPTVFDTTLVKVRAFQSGLQDSLVVSKQITKLAPPTFTPPNGVIGNGQSVTVTPPAGSSVKAVEARPNLIDSSQWSLGCVTQTGFTAYGSTAENCVELQNTPYGGPQEPVWTTHHDVADDYDGGWITSNFTIDPTKTYRFSAWIKKTAPTASSPGWTFFGAGSWTGTHGLTDIPATQGGADGSVYPYGYLVGYNGLPVNQWFYFVGHVRPMGAYGSPYSSSVYDLAGVSQASSTDLRWANDSSPNLSSHRAFQIYCNDTSVQQQFWKPRVEVVDSINDPKDVLTVSAGVVDAPKVLTFAGSGTREVLACSWSDTALRSDVVRRIFAGQIDVPTVTTSTSGSTVTFNASTSQSGAHVEYSRNGGVSWVSSSSVQTDVTENVSWRAVLGGNVFSDVLQFAGASLIKPAFNPEAGTYNNDISVTVSPPAGGAKLKAKRSYPNLINPGSWTLGCVTQPGFLQYGDQAENCVELQSTPYGGPQEAVWTTHHDNADSANGGWITSNFTIDPTKTYRFSAWIKKTAPTASSPGWTFFGAGSWTGTHGLTDIPATQGGADGSVYPYGYLVGYNGLPVNQWFYFVGHVRPMGAYGSPYTSSVYDVAGVPRTSSTDLRWASDSSPNLSSHRAFQIYCNDTTVQQQFWNPRVELVDAVTDPVEVMFATEETGSKSIPLSGNVNNEIQAISWYASGVQSGIASRIYTFQAAKPTVTSDPATGGNVTLTAASATAFAQIRYTTNDSEPVESSTLYTSPVTLSASLKVKFKAFKANYNPSELFTIFPTYAPADMDSDGLPDAWEQQYFGSLSQNGAGDPDGDGKTNAQEFAESTDPTQPPFTSQLSRPRKDAVLP